MKLILDNIIFCIQRMGGISVVWQELLQRALCDPDLDCTILDYDKGHNNLCRQALQIDQHVSLKYRRWERYRTPNIHFSEKALFHSSYFRVLQDKYIRNVTTVHDLTYHFYRQGAAKWVHLAEEQHALRHSTGVICVSENTKSDLLRLYPWLKEEHVRVVYNGVGCNFKPQPEAINEGYLLFVGNRAVDYKRLDIAIRVAQLSHTPLVMIGGKLSLEEDRLLRQTLGEGMYKAVSNIPNERLCDYYNRALCLIYPSDYEGFGIPIVEAQKCGCPVIAQAVSSVPEIAGGAALLFPHQDTESMAQEMADAVRQLKNGTFSRTTLQEAGILNAQRFSWEYTYQQTKEFYREIYNN